ncbi:MAG: diguanylate cyclase [Magnetococcales bacterium]|nr:diguanylate cyclase [Magnetococcales bacterium]
MPNMCLIPGNEFLLNSLRVLYVEDDLEICQEMTELLSRYVRQVFPCQDARTGLTCHREQNPDLIITDIRMAFVDGLDMIRQIRQSDPDIPVIVTTAHSSEDYFIRSIELGIDRYLLKPVLPKQILEALTYCARRQWNQRQRNAAARYQEFILDLHPNLLIVLDQERIEYLNQTFLNFAGVSSLQEFKERYNSLEPFLDPPATSAAEGWSSRLLHLACADIPIVFMHHPDAPNSTRQPFAVSCNKHAENNKIIYTFADVTSIENQLRDLRKKAFQDSLTGICNREMLVNVLNGEFKRAARHGSALSIIMIDLDHFKRVNDAFGHLAGDLVLREMSRFIKNKLRGSDVLARWGGEEFMIVTPGTSLEAAHTLAEKIRELVATHTFPQVGTMTASFGVAEFRVGDDQTSLTSRADQALYTAKLDGRNCVRSAQ